MSVLIDPDTIGQWRAAHRIRRGWHVRLPDGTDALAAQDAIVGGYHAAAGLVVGRRTEPGRWPADKTLWTRNLEEQIRYIEARHRAFVAEAGLEKAVLSAQPVPACARPDCAGEIARLNAVIDGLCGSVQVWIADYDDAEDLPAPYTSGRAARTAATGTARDAGWGPRFEWRPVGYWQYLYALDDASARWERTGHRVARLTVPVEGGAR